jgi:hypothetical protein
MMDKDERRMFDRFEMDFAAEIALPEVRRNRPAQCCDISAIGAGVVTKKELLPGTDLEIWLRVPDGRPPFRGLARVVWAKRCQKDKWRLGMEFDAADFMGIKRVFKLISGLDK